MKALLSLDNPRDTVELCELSNFDHCMWAQLLKLF